MAKAARRTSPLPASGEEGQPFLVVLIAAHNEEHCIVATLRSLESQERLPDRIVVAADNCTDGTAAAARSVHGITVFETESNRAKKPGALNQAWRSYCQDADLVVCIDADTILDPGALAEWEQEFVRDPALGGCSAKFTMLTSPAMTRSERTLVRLQRAEFAKWTDLALKRKRRTSVLAGTACCLRNQALREVAMQRTQMSSGTIAAGTAWIETSMVEDFELTYRMRQAGWQTKVSATVRAYTDAMTDLRSLWAQRMKWQSGTVNDLLNFGVNRLTWVDWWQQAQGFLSIAVRLMWLTLFVGGLALGTLVLSPVWLIPPALFLANDVKQSLRIPRREPADVVVAALLVPQEAFAFMRAGWFTASWFRVLGEKFFGLRQPDLWSRQASAERSRRTTRSGGAELVAQPAR